MLFVQNTRNQTWVHIAGIMIIAVNWISNRSWAIGHLPPDRVFLSDVADGIFLTYAVVSFFVRYWAIRKGYDSDAVWQTNVIAFSWAGAVNIVAQASIAAEIGGDHEARVATIMQTFYIAISAMLTLHPPEKRKRNLAATLAPLASVIPVFLIEPTRTHYMHGDTAVRLFGFAILMMLIREAVQQSANAAHKTLVETQAALSASNEARRRLEVQQAIEVERERLMGEVHDGIGSSLVTALAVAKREGHSPSTVELLTKAISELKITVDSLDPLDGDLLAILGNLRHRLEPGLEKAGLSVKWDVQLVPMLPWLDSTNTLQLLRLVQEAVSNALVHSGATQLIFRCFSRSQNDKEGIAIEIEDNGDGFDKSAKLGTGKGFETMQARAKALQGTFACESKPSKGTKLTLWLPLRRG
jgi:signal transduction histidine kinase